MISIVEAPEKLVLEDPQGLPPQPKVRCVDGEWPGIVREGHRHAGGSGTIIGWEEAAQWGFWSAQGREVHRVRGAGPEADHGPEGDELLHGPDSGGHPHFDGRGVLPEDSGRGRRGAVGQRRGPHGSVLPFPAARAVGRVHGPREDGPPVRCGAGRCCRWAGHRRRD